MFCRLSPVILYAVRFHLTRATASLEIPLALQVVPRDDVGF